MQSLVEGISQVQLLHQQLQGPQAGAAQSFGLVGDLKVDVLGPEHGMALFVPLAFAQPLLDASLAIAEPLLYPGFHLKYLRAGAKDGPCNTSISPETPRYFKFFPDQASSGRGGNACFGPSP